jgi:hypothetical protein
MVVVVHRLPNNTKVVDEAHETVAVHHDGHITLAEGVKLGLDVHDTSGSVVVEKRSSMAVQTSKAFFQVASPCSAIRGNRWCRVNL